MTILTTRKSDSTKKSAPAIWKFLKKVPHEIIDANRPYEQVRMDFFGLDKRKIKIMKDIQIKKLIAAEKKASKERNQFDRVGKFCLG